MRAEAEAAQITQQQMQDQVKERMMFMAEQAQKTQERLLAQDREERERSERMMEQMTQRFEEQMR